MCRLQRSDGSAIGAKIRVSINVGKSKVKKPYLLITKYPCPWRRRSSVETLCCARLEPEIPEITVAFLLILLIAMCSLRVYFVSAGCVAFLVFTTNTPYRSVCT